MPKDHADAELETTISSRGRGPMQYIATSDTTPNTSPLRNTEEGTQRHTTHSTHACATPHTRRERGEERRSSHTQTRTNTPWHNPPHTHTAQARRVQSPNPPPIRYAPPSGLGAPAMVGPTKYLPAENIRCTDPTGAPVAGLAVRPVMQRSSHENPTCHVVG